ncbi:Heat shock protein 70 [Spraguea lophii 42_110]|uniref:Heat shock protein 70 n=1 Tax=Spraguea lophii (strain 42_110) TaxID=1358809 RepID=S7XK56_SPRLO|nr:Heat shock protein 70 [Spraguea lophii 42_110]
MLFFISLLRAVVFDDIDSPRAVGIDLGTTYSCVGLVGEGGIETFRTFPFGDKNTMPSVVLFKSEEANGKVRINEMVGWDAFYENEVSPSPEAYVYAIKRIMGISTLKGEKGLENLNEKVTYTISEKENKGMKYLSVDVMDVNNNVIRTTSAVEISGMILGHIYKELSKQYTQIKAIIITVPAYFNENQVQATKVAADMAGMKVSRVVNEPVAAAYAYQIKRRIKDKSDSGESRFLVFDFGGGTLDISILEADGPVLEVKTYSGDNFLGGENVNDCLFFHFLKELKDAGVSLNSEVERLRLRGFVENFKISLCNLQNENDEAGNGKIAEYADKFIYHGVKEQEFKLTSEEFNKICDPVFSKVESCIRGGEDSVLSRYKKQWKATEKDIDVVLLVGGSSRIPWVSTMLGKIFGAKKVSKELDPDLAVAEGASYYAANICKFLDKASSLTLIDVVTMNIGICVNENTFEPIITQDSAIPAQGSKIFTTAVDNQPEVNIRVSQGFRYEFDKNFKLGSVKLKLASLKPRGVPQINVTCSIDKERRVLVKAEDMESGEIVQIEFKRDDYTLSPEVVNRMKAEKEKYAAEDEELRQRNEEIQELESYIASLKSRMVAPAVTEDNRVQIDKAMIGVETWLKSEKSTADKLKFREKLEELKTKCEPLLQGADIPKEQEKAQRTDL